MMKTRNADSALAVLLAFSGAVDGWPPDYSAQLSPHETGGDPTSDHDYLITLGMMNESQDGDRIGSM